MNTLRPIGPWFERVVYAFFAAVFTVMLFMIVVLIYNLFFNFPPVQITNTEPKYLGEFCPGDDIPIHNHVEVSNEVILFYYTSVKDETAAYNIFGTQITYPGFVHGTIAEFDQDVPFEIPDLPPGNYIRSFGARGTDGRQRAIIIENEFTIKENCNE